jgi:hypothetical protein
VRAAPPEPTRPDRPFYHGRTALNARRGQRMLLPERLPQTTNDEPTDDELPDDVRDWIDQETGRDSRQRAAWRSQIGYQSIQASDRADREAMAHEPFAAESPPGAHQ